MDGNVPGGLPKNARLESGLKNELSKKKVTQTGMSKKGIHSKKEQLKERQRCKERTWSFQTKERQRKEYGAFSRDIASGDTLESEF